MDYVAIYPKVYIIYYASKIILNINSDVTYLVAPKSRSRVAGYYHLTGDHTKNLKLNGDIHAECKTLRHMVSSTTEAEVGEVFHNAPIAIPIRTLLHALGHP